MMHRKEMTAILIVVAGVALVLVYTATRAIGQILAFNDNTPSTALIVDESGWQTYKNETYGFSINYPQTWRIATDGLSANVPFVALGNPLQGTSTYALEIFIENNSSSLSSGEYVHQLLSADKAEDAANAASGPAPQITPQFTKSFVTQAGSHDAYELFHVFEFDHNAEKIYVAHGNVVLRFDFPTAEENPNLSSPAHNNAVAHEIIDTLMW